ncbi:hypothetical protein LC087_12675 [Bacillus carboniphilus]|uniref:Uncharacterized protein n=1 Tax=Bacillus carboniphilus TaxID=86663 RepID=A0ABY9JT80_9BACI|nr:hypothetical protein [Bacillus carboniphilus]WLR41713.1 hypothetical protein LC087_12675 [Bacillus carboniphilus]
MKKLFGLLLLSMAYFIVFPFAAYAINDEELGEIRFMTEKQVLKNVEDVKDFLKIQDNTLVIEGDDIDRDKINNEIIQDKKIPSLTKYDNTKSKNLNSPKKISPPENNLKNVVPTKSVTTQITIHNIYGKLTLDYETVSFPNDSTKFEVKNIMNEYLKDKENNLKEDKINMFIEDMKEIYENPNKTVNTSLQTTTQGEFQGIVRKTVWAWDTWYHHDISEQVLVGKAITDYKIYDNGGTESDYDYFSVVQDTQGWTGKGYYSNEYYQTVTNAFQTDIDNYWVEDKLYDWAPDTDDVELNNGQDYSFNFGFPASLSIDFEWNAPSGIKMRGEGDKTNGYFTNFFYTPSGGDFDNDGSFTLENGANYKLDWSMVDSSYNRTLILDILTHFRGYVINEDVMQWYSDIDVLHYDY